LRRPLLLALVAGGLVAWRHRSRGDAEAGGGAEGSDLVETDEAVGGEERSNLIEKDEASGVTEAPSAEAPSRQMVEEEIAEPAPYPQARSPRRWPWLALLLLALVLGGLLAWWLLSRDDGGQGSAGGNAPPVTSTRGVIPNVIGLPRVQAMARIKGSGFVARVVKRPSGDVPPDSVFAEKPKAGSHAPGKTVVTLSVAVGPPVTVPGVVGQLAAGATASLRARGLAVRYAGVFSDKDRGTVLAQSPAAGATAAKGSTVVLRVSRGSGVVPSVVGLTRSSAEAVLEAAGFKAKAFTVPAKEAKGRVVAQSPLAGIRAPGVQVRLYVSGGPSPAPAPPPPA